MKHSNAIRNIGRSAPSAVGALFLFLFMLWVIPLFFPSIEGIWGINTTVVMNTSVNITNAAPEIIGSPYLQTPINLEAYGNQTVQCNVTVFDWDNDTLNVNATMYINGISFSSSPNDGNNHYSVPNCTRVTAQDLYMNYSCNFSMYYYADNSSNWMCNVTVIDDNNAFSTNVSGTARVEPLVAIYAPGSLSYGELMVNQISESKLANITNAGNRQINISVTGWAVTQNDNLSMNCSYGNIALALEKYLGANNTYVNMRSLNISSVLIPGFFISQRTSEVLESMNATYWRLQIPPYAGGICTGKILFTASDYRG